MKNVWMTTVLWGLIMMGPVYGVLISDDFEGQPPGTVPDGWLGKTNNMSIVADAAVGRGGTNAAQIVNTESMHTSSVFQNFTGGSTNLVLEFDYMVEDAGAIPILRFYDNSPWTVLTQNIVLFHPVIGKARYGATDIGSTLSLTNWYHIEIELTDTVRIRVTDLEDGGALIGEVSNLAFTAGNTVDEADRIGFTHYYSSSTDGSYTIDNLILITVPYISQEAQDCLDFYGFSSLTNTILSYLDKAGVVALGPVPLSEEEKDWINPSYSDIVLAPTSVTALATSGDGSEGNPWMHPMRLYFTNNPSVTETVIKFPPGHYCERGVVMNDKTWIMPSSGTVKVQAIQGGTPDYVFEMGYECGLRGLELAGVSDKTAVIVPKGNHNCVVYDCWIHDFGYHGVQAKDQLTYRLRVIGNLFEDIGYLGVVPGMVGLVKNNGILSAGYIHVSDAIRAASNSDYVDIVNNIVVQDSESGNFRDGIVLQSSWSNPSQFCEVSGNLVLQDYTVWGGIWLADGSFDNTVRGNVVLGVDDSGLQGIHVSGGRNDIYGNVSMNVAWPFWLNSTLETFTNNCVYLNRFSRHPDNPGTYEIRYKLSVGADWYDENYFWDNDEDDIYMYFH